MPTSDKPTWHLCLPVYPADTDGPDICDNAVMRGMDARYFKHWMKPLLLVDYGDIAVHIYVVRRGYKFHPLYIYLRAAAFLRNFWMRWILAGGW